MENSRGFKENYGPVHTKDYRMMQGFGHTDSDVQSDTLSLDVAADFGKEDLHPGKKYFVACHVKPLHLKNCDTLGFEDKITSDTEDSMNSLIPPLPLSVPYHEKAQDLDFAASSLAKEAFPAKQCASDCQDVSKGTSECDLKLTEEDFKEHKSAASKICGDTEPINRSMIIKRKESCLRSDDTKREFVQAERKNLLPLPKCFADVADYPEEHQSSVDLFEEETFFSIKSGSFHSGSSSPFSFDDSTDIGQCVFEEAFEDFSSLSLDRQFHDSPIVPYAKVQSPLWDPSIQYINHPSDEGIAKSAIIKQRSISCNVDRSWVSLSHNDKETQTRESTQEAGVNTDPIQHGLYSQVAATKEVGTATDVEESKTSGCSSSVSPEALLQRAVKAELQLVDLHRWLRWQMCLKTQQQTIVKQSLLNLSKEPVEQSTSMPNFNLSSALAELEEKYQEMRAKIQSGTPLDSLVPLTMQITTFEMSTDNLLNDASQHERKRIVPDVSTQDLKQDKCMENDFGESFLSCLDECEQNLNEIHFAEDLSEKPCTYYVHVGNIATCVKEVQVIEVFQKFHVLTVFLEELSLTCSYAVLTFRKSEEAEAATKEMDGKMFFGKKLKVRVIKTPNYNVSFAFQKIKSVSREIPQDEEGRFDTFEPKEGFGSQPLKSNSFQCDQTQAAPVYDDLTNLYVNMPEKGYPYMNMNTNQGLPAAPPTNTFGFYNCMTPNYQWMIQAPHSNIPCNSMPNCMFVPFSYPLYKLPNHPPFLPVLHPAMPAVPHPPMPTMTQPPIPTMAHPPNFGISKKPYVNIKFGKDHSSRVHAKPRKGMDQRSIFGISQSFVLNQVNSPTEKTEQFKRDTGVTFIEAKPVTVKPISDLTLLTASSNAKPQHSATASQDDSLKTSASVTTAGVHHVGTTAIDCFSSCDKQDNISGLPNFKSAAPLRSPVFVPRSVTIPEASKPSVDPNFNSKVLTISEKQAEVNSSVTSLQRDSLPAGKMDWGVYPKLDLSSELPTVIIANKLNFSQFKRVMKHLAELHKDAPRDRIVAALDEVMRNTGGYLSALTIPEIILAVSSKLAGNLPPA